MTGTHSPLSSFVRCFCRYFDGLSSLSWLAVALSLLSEAYCLCMHELVQNNNDLSCLPHATWLKEAARKGYRPSALQAAYSHS